MSEGIQVFLDRLVFTLEVKDKVDQLFIVESLEVLFEFLDGHFFLRFRDVDRGFLYSPKHNQTSTAVAEFTLTLHTHTVSARTLFFVHI